MSNIDNELRDKIQAKMQFCHRSTCPADPIIDGKADLNKCNCAVKDAVEAIYQLVVESQNELKEKIKVLREEARLDGRIQEAQSTIAMYGSTSYTPNLKKNIGNRIKRYKKRLNEVELEQSQLSSIGGKTE